MSKYNLHCQHIACPDHTDPLDKSHTHPRFVWSLLKLEHLFQLYLWFLFIPDDVSHEVLAVKETLSSEL